MPIYTNKIFVYVDLEFGDLGTLGMSCVLVYDRQEQRCVGTRRKEISRCLFDILKVSSQINTLEMSHYFPFWVINRREIIA